MPHPVPRGAGVGEECDEPLSANSILTLIVTLAVTAVAYGLTYWVYRADQDDRSARLGLFLLFGVPGGLLVVIGAAYAVNGMEKGWYWLAVGLGLSAPLLAPLRRLFGRVTPIDAGSPIDMAGLCVILAVALFYVASYAISARPQDPGQEVNVTSALATFLAEIAFSYVLVGLGLRRGFRAANERLGLRPPSPKIVAWGIGLVLVTMILVQAGGVATDVFQPDLTKQIADANRNLTGQFRSTGGALFLGIGAGIGEELLFRGALLPRYGIPISSALFALLHGQNGFSFLMLGIFFVGVLFGLERKYLGTTAAIITHATFDIVVVLIASRA